MYMKSGAEICVKKRESPHKNKEIPFALRIFNFEYKDVLHQKAYRWAHDKDD